MEAELSWRILSSVDDSAQAPEDSSDNVSFNLFYWKRKKETQPMHKPLEYGGGRVEVYSAHVTTKSF